MNAFMIMHVSDKCNNRLKFFIGSFVSAKQLLSPEFCSYDLIKSKIESYKISDLHLLQVLRICVFTVFFQGC